MFYTTAMTLLIPFTLLAQNSFAAEESNWEKASREVAAATFSQVSKLAPEEFSCDYHFKESENGVVVKSDSLPKFDINSPAAATVYGYIFGWLQSAHIPKHQVWVSANAKIPYQVKILTFESFKSTAFILKSAPDKLSFSDFRYGMASAETVKRSVGPLDHPVIKKVVVRKDFFGECNHK